MIGAIEGINSEKSSGRGHHGEERSEVILIVGKSQFWILVTKQ